MSKFFWALASIIVVLGTSNAARAASTCTVPNSTTLNVLPDGCEAVLTNGPIFYTGVLASNGDHFNIEVDSVILSGLNNGASSLNVFIQGISTDTTTSTSNPFSNFSTSTFFQTNPLNNTYGANSGTQTFGIAHFIDTLPGVFTLKLNFGEAGPPAQGPLDVVTSGATTGAGTYIVSSFFDVYTELSLNGGTNYTVASNDFSGNAAGPGAQFQLQNTPEPATAGLIACGLAALYLARRRARNH
jgi:hypothetical protein